MGLFDRFKSNKTVQLPKGAHQLVVKNVTPLTTEAVQISFELPLELQRAFAYQPGQYLTVQLEINGKQERRSYSICSGPQEDLAIGVKKLDGGKVSTRLQQIEKGQQIVVFEPEGAFVFKPEHKKVVAIAAGSGITPIMSMLKSAAPAVQFHLIYGNKRPDLTLFLNQINALTNTTFVPFYSQTTIEGAHHGRIDEQQLKELIKTDLSILQADAYFLCGPQGLVEMAEATLTFFGVAQNKIYKELFFASETPKANATEAFSGKSHVKVMLEGDIVEFDTNGSDKSLLELAEKAGLDAPFSCRGGVCSSCRAKVLQGTAQMRINHALTDAEVANGYILSCQAHPTSENLIISFDE
ncbi:MAG: 2Fe-2S iron-sulfur cluster-binding protein [Flavobacteriales bacterium]